MTTPTHDEIARASKRLQDAGILGKAIADEFLRRHREAVREILAVDTVTGKQVHLNELPAILAKYRQENEPPAAAEAATDVRPEDAMKVKGSVNTTLDPYFKPEFTTVDMPTEDWVIVSDGDNDEDTEVIDG